MCACSSPLGHNTQGVFPNMSSKNVPGLQGAGEDEMEIGMGIEIKLELSLT